MTDVSVTEVRNALRCPRVFALGRQLGQRVMFPMSASSLGSVFHRLADVFARGVEKPPARMAALGSSATATQVEGALRAWLLGLLVTELESADAYSSMPNEVDDLAEALRQFAAYLTAEVMRAKRRPADALTELVKATELEAEAVVSTAAGSVRVVGRIDALYAPSGRSHEVVEYKLTDESNAELDEAQVALYRLMLRMQHRIDAVPVVLRFNPALSATRLDAGRADALAEERLLPLIGRMATWIEDPSRAPAPRRRDLCPVCPMRGACADAYRDALPARDEPPSGALRPRPDPSGAVRAPELSLVEPSPEPDEDLDGQREGAEVRDAIAAILDKLGVSATLGRTPEVGARLIGVEVTLLRGRVGSLDRAAQDVVHRLRAERHVDAQYEHSGGLRKFVVPRRNPRTVRLDRLLARSTSWLAERPGRFVLGEGTDNSPVRGDFSDPSCCHLLVGGMAGSGKSVLLRSLIASLVHAQAPSAITFTLIDPKRVSFGPLAVSMAAHLTQPISFEAADAVRVLAELVAEMEERYQRLLAAKVQDLGEYNEVVPASEQLPRRIVVIDEFADLVIDKESKDDFLRAIQRLGAKARAAGIHLVLATQRPDRQVVPGIIKANMAGKVALRVQSGVDSRIVLDAPGAERLLGKGDMLANVGDGLVRAQAGVGA